MADAPSPHGLNSAHHTGTLDNSQIPQALLTDGTRTLAGNLAVSSGVTVDGVDISVLKNNYDTHLGDPVAHNYIRNLLSDDDEAAPKGVTTNDVKIYGVNGTTVTKTVDGLAIDGGGGGGGGSSFSGIKDPAATGVAPDGSGWILTTDDNVVNVAASGANTLAFTVTQANINHGNIGGVSANQHHNQQHVLATNSALGADHTISGATAGHVLRASSATAAAFSQLAHTELSSIGTNTHAQIDTHIAATGTSVHGLGTMSTQAASAVAITGGTVTGITDLTVADGGTGASTASDARTNLGVGTGDSPQFAAVNVGHASDTTLTRVSAGLMGVDGISTATITAPANLSISPTGDVVFDPTGNDILPNTGYDLNIGSLSKKYLTLHASELWVETLVAQNTIATIGGRILVGPTTTLTRDLADGAGDTTIYVKHNEMASGDRAYMEAQGKVEFFAITSSPTTITPDVEYSYTVTRNLDPSGRNFWYAGDAMFNTGTTGNGFIDIYSVQSMKPGVTQAGPSIVGNVRNSATYNDWSEHWAIGNLNGLYGYGVDTYGAAFGKYASGQPWISVDATNGFRVMRHTTQMAQWDTSGNILVGQTGAGQSNIYITSGGVQLRNDTTKKIDLQTDGDVFIGTDTSAAATTTLAVFSASQTYNGETMGVGDLLLGDNSSGKANIWWDKSAGLLYFRGGTTAGAYVNTTGSIVAGAGAVTLDDNGIDIASGSGDVNLVSWKTGGNHTGYIFSDRVSTTNRARFNAVNSTSTGSIVLQATAKDNGDSWIELIEEAVSNNFKGVFIGKVGGEPTAMLDVNGIPGSTFKTDSSGNLTASTIALPNHFAGTYASVVNGSVRQVYANPVSSGTDNMLTLAGFYARTNYGNTAGQLTHGFGLVGRIEKTGAGSTAQLLSGVYSDFIITASGDIDQACGFFQNPANVTAGTIGQVFMADLNEPEVTGTGVVEDNYGIRIGATTVGTGSNFGLYIEQSAGYGIYNSDGDFYSNGTSTLIGDMSLTGDLAVADGNVSIIAGDVLGSELVTNGEFTSATTGWAAGGSATLASIAGGQSGNCLEVTNAGGTGYAVQTLTTVVGQRYRLTLYYKNGTATQGAIYIGTTSGGSQIYSVSLATAASWTARTIDFTATTTTSYLRIGVAGSTAGHTMLYDTVSAKSLLGGTLGVNAKITGYGGTAGMAISASTGEVTTDHRVTAKGGYRTHSQTINDDIAIDLRSLYPNLATGGLLMLSSVGYANTAGVINYRTASSPFCTVVAQPGTDIVVGTTALTDGTSDGTDGKLNVAAVSTGELFVKNRRGTAAVFTFTVLD